MSDCADLQDIIIERSRKPMEYLQSIQVLRPKTKENNNICCGEDLIYEIHRNNKQTVLFLPKIFCFITVLQGECSVCGQIYHYDGRHDGLYHILRSF